MIQIYRKARLTGKGSYSGWDDWLVTTLCHVNLTPAQLQQIALLDAAVDYANPKQSGWLEGVIDGIGAVQVYPNKLSNLDRAYWLDEHFTLEGTGET